MWTVAQHARFAFLEEDLVIFDLERDRYLALPGAIDPSTRNAEWPEIHPEALISLSAADYLTLTGSEPPLRLHPPARSMTVAEARASVADASRLVRILATVGLRMRRGRHVRRFATDHLTSCPPEDEARIRDWLGRLRSLRLAVPTPKRCLPAALTTALFLDRHGLIVDLVFGVRGHPFDAHCWLEWNGMVLDDDLDRVRAYTPIAVGRA